MYKNFLSILRSCTSIPETGVPGSGLQSPGSFRIVQGRFFLDTAAGIFVCENLSGIFSAANFRAGNFCVQFFCRENYFAG